MNARAIAISILAAVGLIAAACGADSPTPTPQPINTPTPTPSERLTAQCVATEAYAAEHIVAVIGEDLFPSAFDAINRGGCDFNGEISDIEIVLDGPGGTYTALIELPAPATNIGWPLGRDAPVPPLAEAFEPGRYERTVIAITVDRRRVAITGFEPVILVRDRESPQALLLRAQSRWDRSGITSYTYTSAWQCFCAEDLRAPVTVDVLNGVLHSIAFADSRAVDVPNPERFGTVDDLFATIQDAFDRDAARVVVDYEAQLGYPTDAFLDYEKLTIDEEQGFSIKELNVR